MHQDSRPTPDRPPGRFQFRLATLMLAMVLISVPAALFGGFLRPGGDGEYRGRLVLLTLMAPLGLIVLLGVLRLLVRSRQRRRRW
jgi:hypothetical protein